MNKIQFNNSTSPALSDTILMQLQQNIEDAIEELKPVELYNNTSGTLSTVTLSETSDNFSYLEIFYSNSSTNTGMSSVKVNEPNGKKVNLSLVPSQYSNDIGIYGCNISISGTQINFLSGKGITINGKDDNFIKTGFSLTNEIKIYKVIGYR